MTQVTGIQQVMSNLRKYELLLEGDRREIVRFSAGPLIDTIKQATPIGSTVHRRYPSLKGRAKAKKGQGNVITTYRPGSLRGSIEILPLKRTDDTWVGPRRRRVKYSGPKRGDGYYGHIVEFGSKYYTARPYFFRSVHVAAPLVRRRLEFGFQAASNKFTPR